MQHGYIRLYRCMFDKPWSKHPEYVALWIYCLMRGNYTETDIITRTGTHVHLMPGQFVASREQISLNTGIQESKVERILKVFKSEQQIEQQNCGKFRIISILNWSKFQASEQQIEQQMNNKRTTDEQQMNTDNKVKKEKKAKKEEEPLKPSVASLPEWVPVKAWELYLQNRVKIKKPLLPAAYHLAFAQLEKLRDAGYDPEAVLNQSSFAGWQGLFEIKGSSGTASSQKQTFAEMKMGNTKKAMLDFMAQGGLDAGIGESKIHLIDG